jgi:hypothetical protein
MICTGPIDLLAAPPGHWEDAGRHCEEALTMNMKIGAKPEVAHTQYENASVLFTYNQLSTHDKALLPRS